MAATASGERASLSVDGPAGERLYLLTPEGLAPAGGLAAARLGDGLRSLVEQEILGVTSEPEVPRVEELLDAVGCEWEPAAEPGHLRFAPPAAFMLGRIAERARALVGRALPEEIPLFHVEGVKVVDLSTPLMRPYQSLLEATPELYGTRPYRVDGDTGELVLRQTACVQKFSLLRDWISRGLQPPLALYEVSDSFRREPAEVLQRCARVRRFRVAETHVHHRSLPWLLEATLALHETIVDEMRLLSLPFVLLVTVTAEFMAEQRPYLHALARRLGGPALLKVCPPGAICQDGVEADVEYKFVDAAGCARELSTFQIDRRITGALVDAGGEPLWTVHAVPTGSFERYLYAVLTGVAISEQRGAPRPYPSFIAPGAVAVLADDPRRDPLGAEVAGVLATAGIRTELDDRALPLGAKLADADRRLVPVTIPLGPGASTDRLTVRRYRGSGERRAPLARVVDELLAEVEPFLGRPTAPRRLSAAQPPERGSPARSPAKEGLSWEPA